MNEGRTVFSQLMDFLPLHQFRQCVERYSGNCKIQSFTCLDQFLCLAFAQLTFRESLRDIEACLRAQQPKLYHMGFRGAISRSNLGYANEHRDWRIYAAFPQVLMGTARDLYRDEPFGVELSETVYALDSTTIDLCLSLFPWGKFRRRKSAVKLHTLLDLRGSIPTNVYVTGGQVHDVNILDELLLEAGAFYLLDRGYVDFARLYTFTQACAFFITRAKKNMQFYRRYSRPVERSAGLQSYQLKQHLRIKSFYGTSENAVKTQVWVALSVYVLVAIVKKQLGLELSLYKILQILSVTIFEKTPILEGFSNFSDEFPTTEQCIQLSLFDLQ
jgi:hypothetical protein